MTAANAPALKILFVMRTGAHFPYHATTIDYLLKHGHSVTLLFDPTWHKRGRLEHRALEEWLARHPAIQVRDAVQRRGFWRTGLFVCREARSYANYCRRGDEVAYYRERWRQYLPERLRNLAQTRVGAWVFGHPATERLLALVERLTPPDATILASLRTDKPDCVVASPINMRRDEEVEYIKAAKAVGIPTLVPILSWDNLTTKGVLHVEPDLVLAWHKGHQKEARTLHGISSARIAITGSPFFDKWFEVSRPISSRTATCERFNVDPAKPYLLYLGSSATIAKHEWRLVIALMRALRNSSNPALRRLQVVFKPHPANLHPVAELDKAEIPVWPREYGLPDTEDTVGQFRDMLHHAVSTIGVNTTGMVDAILCDRPCIALTVKRYKATQTDATHFQRIAKSKALYIANSMKRAVELLAQIQEGRDTCAGARRNFMQTYARPCGLGGPAGEASALAIEHLTKGSRPSEIVALVHREIAGRPVPAPPRVDAEPAPTPSGLILRSISSAKEDPIFRHYEHVRRVVLAMLDDGRDYGFSAYWKEEIGGFDYMFDASPLVIAKLREHTHHVTGIKPYEYRGHHAKKARQFESKFEQLRDADASNLFVPEAPQLGGFGHRCHGGLMNLDTLKFYECLIALDRAGIVGHLRKSDTRHRVLEVGAGWGGFAYQLKTLFPNTTYIIVDLPPTMLFSATYLKATFPGARLKFYGEGPADELFADLDQTDFLFIPAHAFDWLRIPQVDLAVNMVSFQEMTTEQVVAYVQKLADSGCARLYSLNKDRSKYNRELSAVSEIMQSRYHVESIEVLRVSYTGMDWKPPKIGQYGHLIGTRQVAVPASHGPFAPNRTVDSPTA